VPILSGFRLIFARHQYYLRYRGLPVHFASTRHRKLIAEQLPFLTYVNIDLFFFSFDHLRLTFDIFSDSTLRIPYEQPSSFQTSFTKQINMYLNKENPIIVTKTQYTAEEFIQKKIELWVESLDQFSFISHCFFFDRKIKLNHSMPLTSKIFVTSISDGLL
jgi:hypothetical protein